MGIHQEPADLIRRLPLPKRFTVCELGDQWVTSETPHYLASVFYQTLGCSRYISIDGNGRGTITADLNRPIPASLGLFDLVTDFGTGEHIFHQAQVWRSVHHLTKPKGFIAFDRPSQGYEGHCFYRCDESLFHDLAIANNYGIVALNRRTTARGDMIYGAFQRNGDVKFQMPQQGRYKKALQV